jgi:thiamine biosynthesis lipoprotein
MGTVAEFSTRADGATAERAQKLVARAFRLVETNLSVFVADSAVSRLNRGEIISMASDAPFVKVVRFALETAEASGGAFDPTVNPLMRAWGFRGGAPSVPLETVLSNALATVGWRRISISNGTTGEIVVSAGGAELDFGAIAKGYAVDFAYERLVENGFTDFLINLGGNIRVCGSPEPGRKEWNVAVRDPSGRRPPSPLPRPLRSGEAVATSGSYERFVEIDGRRYSHIIDPRTGHPVDNGLGSVSVIAPTAMEADAYSTTLFVLGREAGAAFLATRSGCTAVFIDSRL